MCTTPLSSLIGVELVYPRMASCHWITYELSHAILYFHSSDIDVSSLMKVFVMLFYSVGW